MKIKEILKQAVDSLKKSKIKNPNFEAEIILTHTLKKTREFILTYPEKIISKKQELLFKKNITLRSENIPVAYLTGHKEFYGIDFFVDKNVLIPRPETELMIDETLDLIKTFKPKNIIDIGTGSGCIIITLAKIIKKKINFYAIDVSKKALKISRKNAKKNNVSKKIKFLNNDLLENKKEIKNIFKSREKTIILANLPYLNIQQIKKSPSIKYEPKKALIAGHDGLKYYKKLFRQLQKNIISEKKIYVFCEIDNSQNKKMIEIIKKYFPKSEIKTKKDLKGLNRLIITKI